MRDQWTWENHAWNEASRLGTRLFPLLHPQVGTCMRPVVHRWKKKKSNLEQIIEAVISVRIANITPAPQASMHPFCSRTRPNPVATLLSTHSVWLIQPAISSCIHSSAALLRAHCQLVGLECPVPRCSEWPPISPTCSVVRTWRDQLVPRSTLSI